MKTSGIKVIAATVAITLITGNSCKKPTTPSVSTLEVKEITHYSAVFYGDISSDGGSDIITKGFVWAEHANPRLTDSKFEDESTAAGVFSYELTGLFPQMTYYVRAFATNEEGTSYGEVVSFNTSVIAEYLITRLDATYTTSFYGDVYEDSTSIYFMYDAQFRLAKLIYENLDYAMWRVFVYDAAGKIFRIEDHLNDGYSYFEYTWNGQEITGKIFNYEHEFNEYDYFKYVFVVNTDNAIEKIELYRRYEQDWELIMYAVCLYEDKNLIKMETFERDDRKSHAKALVSKIPGIARRHSSGQKDFLKNATIQPSEDGFACYHTQTFTYDEQNNPLYPNKVIALLYLDEEKDYGMFLSKNNILSCKTVIYPDTEYSFEYEQFFAYEYNHRGYPTKSTLSVSMEGYSETIVMKYTYSFD